MERLQARSDTFFRVSPGERGNLEYFAVRLSTLNGRLDPHYHHPSFSRLVEHIKSIGSNSLDALIQYSNETWNKSDGRFTELFPYIEISGVGLGTNEYQVTQTHISEAPSRARQVVRTGDILISMTRPHRGAVARILPEDDGAIASTGFAIVRHVDANQIDREYLRNCLSVPFGSDQMLMRSSGGSYPAIIKDELSLVLIPHVPLKRQRQLANAMEEAWHSRRAKLAEADALLEGIGDFVLDTLMVTPLIEDSRQVFGVKVYNLKTLSLGPQSYAPVLQQFLNELRKNPSVSKPLSAYVGINPRANTSGIDDNDLVGFVPMEAVSHRATGEYAAVHRPLREVKKGFTPFRNGDILWAKITPCMQNGKIFIADALPNGVGYASTEFHVLRVWSKDVSTEFVKEFLSQVTLRRLATFVFTGTAGQQRVPPEFIAGLPFPALPLEQQNEIVESIKSVRGKARRLRTEAESGWQDAKRWFEGQLLGE
ncbi:MAG: hypothetical protein OXC95_11965 [Dehalococcoidia bacterium]|nr:hypothetical protein [Dehalococcoidia bacterium]